MENRGNRTSKKLAQTETELYRFRSSAHASRNSAKQETPVDEPEIKIEFKDDVNEFLAGDFLICEYFVDLKPEHDVQAIETSVIWLTEGKGDSDIGVHFFERRPKQAFTADTFKQSQRASTVLPASPLTYEGEILKVRWCVRVRLFFADDMQITKDEYFRLGNVESFDQSVNGSSSGDDDLVEDESPQTGAA